LQHFYDLVPGAEELDILEDVAEDHWKSVERALSRDVDPVDDSIARDAMIVWLQEEFGATVIFDYDSDWPTS
jgi:hypothetical protein